MKSGYSALKAFFGPGGWIHTQIESIQTLLANIETKLADIKTAVGLTHVNIDFSSSAAQTIIAAPGSGKRIRVTALTLTALVNVELAVKSGSTTIMTLQFIALDLARPIPINLGTNEALVLDSVTADRITGGVSYYVEDVT